MATSGNIQTLFKNREQTEAIFPRTKVRAVTDDDGNRLDVILEDVVHIGDKVIDTSSVPVNVDTLGGIPAEDYATEAWVKNEIANIQAGEDVDLSGFASQDDITLLNKRINELDYPVDSVNEKTGAVVLNAEDVGAHPNTWLPTPAQIGAVSVEAFNAQLESYLSRHAQINQSTLCFSIKGNANVASYLSRVPVTLHISTQTDCIGFIQFNARTENGSPIGPAYINFGNLPIMSFKFRTDGDTTTYLLQSFDWNWWGGVEIKTHHQLIVEGRNDTTLDSATEMYDVNQFHYAGNGEKEWVNPPMVLGVEYRTTERWQGKVVYTKLVNVGTTSKGTQTIPHGISATEAIRCAGMFPNAAHGTLPYDDGTNKMHIHADKTNFTITANIAGIEVYATIWYTKD